MFGELLKSVLAPPVPQVLGLCAFLSTSALIFAKDIISFIAYNEMLGRRGSASKYSVVPMILDYSVIPAPAVQRTGSAQVSINLQEGTCLCTGSVAGTCGVG